MIKSFNMACCLNARKQTFPVDRAVPIVAATQSTATLELPEHWRLMSSTFHFDELRPFRPRPEAVGPQEPPLFNGELALSGELSLVSTRFPPLDDSTRRSSTRGSCRVPQEDGHKAPGTLRPGSGGRAATPLNPTCQEPPPALG